MKILRHLLSIFVVLLLFVFGFLIAEMTMMGWSFFDLMRYITRELYLLGTEMSKFIKEILFDL